MWAHYGQQNIQYTTKRPKVHNARCPKVDDTRPKAHDTAARRAWFVAPCPGLSLIIERNYEVGHTTLELDTSASKGLRLKLAVGAKELPQ